MNWDNLLYVWDEILAFFDKTFQWLQYVFGVIDEWPPEEFPDINK